MTKEIITTLILAVAPISEIRGAVIYGMHSGLDPITVYIISVIGNFLPVPLLLLAFRPIVKWMQRISVFRKFAIWIEEHVMKKSKNMTKTAVLALFIFVAIPLPTTGAWTGSAIASLLDMRYKYALPAILAGIMVAGLIVMGIMTGILNFGILNNLFVK